MKKIVKNKKGVSEVVGVIIMLGIAIALFSIVYIMAINFPFNEPNPYVRLSATIDDDTIVIVHQGGESLSLNTEIIITVEGCPNIPIETAYNLSDDISRSNGTWDIGEKLLYNFSAGYSPCPSIVLNGVEVRITVVDVISNSVVMQGTVRGND
jgi:flagellin-like protein